MTDRPAPSNRDTVKRLPRGIQLEAVRVHNLQSIDLTLPLRRLIVITGVSGSGKSSLAFDTLFAEGQRRYIESFSTYARQFLDRLEKPDADRIDHIPPAIAVRQNSTAGGGKSTVATATEIHDFLRLLFARAGQIVCPGCGRAIHSDTPQHALETISQFVEGTRFQIGFPTVTQQSDSDTAELLTELKQAGFARAIQNGRTIDLRDGTLSSNPADTETWVVVDRLTAGSSGQERILDSLETAFQHGDGRCLVLESIGSHPAEDERQHVTIDDREWIVHRLNRQLSCDPCGREFQPPEPRLFSFNSPLGACPKCSGFGSIPAISFDRLVPDPSLSLRDGAIAAWTTPAYRHELDELLELAADYQIPVDVPFSDLEPQHLQLIHDGVPEREFGGLQGFFGWLERHKYKLSVRVFLNRWRVYETCPACEGHCLQPNALAVKLGGIHIAELCRRPLAEVNAFFDALARTLSPDKQEVTAAITGEARARLRYLTDAGLGYLSLDRPVRTLSGGESRRVALTAALGSSLVNTLYVLDEPSAGLHPRDNERVIDAIKRLRDAGNTVVVVEHDEAFLHEADELIDIGPGAGREGGRVVFQGIPTEIGAVEESVTGAFVSGRRSITVPSPENRRKPGAARIRLEGVRHHNLNDLTVEFPLGLLCVVTGVSGSGKSSLVHETLYPALCRQLGQSCDVAQPGTFECITGCDDVDQVVLVDPSPVGRTRRSIPVTYLKAFDVIRGVFAETREARVRNFTATTFSFNAARGGRCPSCLGSGTVDIDMQFLADISMTCAECHGRRFRREVLEVKYRGRNIADVLDMTVHEAFTFFRTHPKLLKKLRFLSEVGLDYLPLGQPATTLSGGELQRLKLAAFLSEGAKSRTLFLIDEPTTGLHAADVERLLDCFAGLLSVGHSLIVIEHQLDVIKSADYVIDLGPEAGAAGGQLVVAGTPEQVAGDANSTTGRYLRTVSVAPV